MTTPEGEVPEAAPPPSVPVTDAATRRRALPRRMLAALMLVAAALIVYDVVAGRLATNEAAATPRDPETGIMAGAEPRDLGPENAKGAVLFVHGFAGAANNFADVPDRLAARGWRVRVMRLPGHGTTPRDFAEQNPDDLLAAVQAEIDALTAKHDKVILIGHSMGGALSTLAASHADVDGLVLAAPYFGVTYHWFYLLPPEVWTEIARPIIPWIYKGKLFMQVNRVEAKDRIVSYNWIPTRASVTLARIGRSAKRPAVLKQITCPVLLLHSMGDKAASPKAAARAFAALGAEQKRAVWLERSNHHIFWDFEREEVAREILNFVGAPPGESPEVEARAESVRKEEPMANDVSYLVRRATRTPALDGQWDAPPWNEADTLAVTHFHPDSSDHRPVTRARLLYDKDGLYVMFRVEDRYVRCIHCGYQADVYKDACAEFFARPRPDKGYFNFEMNCGGSLLLKYIEDSRRGPGGFAKSLDVPAEIAQRITIYHELPERIDPEMPDAITWTIAYVIPFNLFEEYVGPLEDVSGMTWRANFYKCAEDNSHPHWAAWSSVGEEKNFHQPDRFGEIRFE